MSQHIDIEKLARENLVLMLQNNIQGMYQRGFEDGTRAILMETAAALENAGKSSVCPDDLAPGLVEASKYLRSVATGTKYQLRSKDLDDVPSDPTVVADSIKKTIKKKKLEAHA